MKFTHILLTVLSLYFIDLKGQDTILSNLEGIWINPYNSNKMEIWNEDSTGWSGRAVVIKDGDTVVLEKLRIFRRSDSLILEADVMHNPGPVEFHLLASTDDEMVFVNMKHDFPKVIHYKMPDKDHLEAEVYGSSYAERLNFHFYRKPIWRLDYIYQEDK